MRSFDRVEETNKSHNNEKGSLEEAIFTRRSTRSFDASKKIPEDVLKSILESALQAPSPKNRQPWYFVAVCQDDSKIRIAHILQEKLMQLQEERKKQSVSAEIEDLQLARGSVHVLRDASVLVFVGYERDLSNEHGDKSNWPLNARQFEAADIQSIGAAIQNMLLMATSKGVDSLWICDVLYAYDELMLYLGMKSPMIAAVALGYKTTHSTSRMRLNEKVEFYDK